MATCPDVVLNFVLSIHYSLFDSASNSCSVNKVGMGRKGHAALDIA